MTIIFPSERKSIRKINTSNGGTKEVMEDFLACLCRREKLKELRVRGRLAVTFTPSRLGKAQEGQRNSVFSCIFYFC